MTECRKGPGAWWGRVNGLNCPSELRSFAGQIALTQVRRGRVLGLQLHCNFDFTLFMILYFSISFSFLS